MLETSSARRDPGHPKSRSDMGADLVISIGDLAGDLEREREFSGTREVSLRLGDSTVKGPMTVTGVVVGTVDGVQANFRVAANARLTCVRCLTEWEEQLETEGLQHFSVTPDENGYAIVDKEVDVGGAATDELALSMPATPVCREDCKGLCPICGTDLNSDPCDGHGEDSGSPFAVLKDLFDS